MTLNNGKLTWAPKVPRKKISSLYMLDAQGIIDEELIDEVGWALWSRCDSILTVTAAHYGRVSCPSCGEIIVRQGPGPDHQNLRCPACDWQMSWADYHQTYRGKQLIGTNALVIFEAYHQAFPQTKAANTKMLLIDQFIHAFHLGLTEIGRPVAANLIEGTLKDVIRFLDALTNGITSATGMGNSREEWRRTLETASWSQLFIEPESDTENPPEI